MYHIRFSIIAVVILNCSISNGQFSGDLCIDKVNVISMSKDTVLYDHRVWVEDGKIVSIEKASTPIGNKEIFIIDGSGQFLIPGLAEMHYHYRNDDIVSDFKLFIANGITTVRNMGQFLGHDHIDYRNRTKSGKLLVPNYFTTGPYLTKSDLNTKSDVNKVVSEHVIKGFDFLKIADNLSDSIYTKLLEEAQNHRLPIVGHAQRHLPLEYSLRMKSIEHIEEFIYLNDDMDGKPLIEKNESELQDVARQIQQSGIYLGTTLAVFEFINNCLNDQKFEAYKTDRLTKYISRDQRENFLTERNDYRKLKSRSFNGISAPKLFEDYNTWMTNFVKVLSNNGVPLIAGSDTYGMVVVGFSLHRELELLQQAGMRPYEILLSSTVSPARYLNTISTEGTISIGKNANMVLLDKNPLEDINHTKTINGVIVRGKWFSKQRLKGMLEDVAREFN